MKGIEDNFIPLKNKPCLLGNLAKNKYDYFLRTGFLWTPAELIL